MPEHPPAALAKITKECLSLRIRMLNRAITQFYDDALRPCQLKSSQFNILALAIHWEEIQPSELVDLLHIDASTLSRNLARMAEQGWIEFVSSRDGRAQPFRLTTLGKNLLKQATPFWETAQEQASELLGEMGVALLRDTTKRLGLKTIAPQ
jgi:DNA-binding MarR family transcriptional regulator